MPRMQRELRTGTQATTGDIVGALSGSGTTATEPTTTTTTPTTTTMISESSGSASGTTDTMTTSSSTTGPIEPETVAPVEVVTNKGNDQETNTDTLMPPSGQSGSPKDPSKSSSSAIGATTNKASSSGSKTMVTITFVVGALVIIALTIVFVRKRRKVRKGKFTTNSTMFSPHFSPTDNNQKLDEGNFTVAAPSIVSVQASQARVTRVSHAESRGDASAFQFNPEVSPAMKFKPSFAPSTSTASSIQFNLGPSSFVMMDMPQSTMSKPSEVPSDSTASSFSTGFSIGDSRGTALEMSSIMGDANGMEPMIKIIASPVSVLSETMTDGSPVAVVAAPSPVPDPIPEAALVAAPTTADSAPAPARKKLVDLRQFSSRELLDVTAATKQNAPDRFSNNSLHDSEFGDFSALPKGQEPVKPDQRLGQIGESHVHEMVPLPGLAGAVPLPGLAGKPDSGDPEDPGPSESVISFYSEASTADASDEVSDLPTPKKNSEVIEIRANADGNKEFWI